MPISNFGFPF